MEQIIKKHYPSIPQSFGITGILIASMLLFSPIIFLEQSIGKQLSMLFYYVLAMGIAFWLIFTVRRKKTGIGYINFKHSNPGIIPIIIIASIAIVLGIIIPITSLIPIPEFFKEIFLSMGRDHGIYTFILLVIAAPLFEELIFRGIVLDGFLKKYSPARSILVSSILFGLVHLNPWQFVSAFFIGCFMGWIYYRTRSLWLTIIIHASVNFFGFISTFLSETTAADLDKNIAETYGGVTNFLIIVTGSWIAIVVSVNYLNKYFNHEDKVASTYVNDNVPSLNE